MERLGGPAIEFDSSKVVGNVRDRRSHPSVVVRGLISSRWPAQTVNLRQEAFLDAVTGVAVMEVTWSEP